eukprot:scaffold22482_cov69-Phaeocystis_antarctica.AAC.9
MILEAPRAAQPPLPAHLSASAAAAAPQGAPPCTPAARRLHGVLIVSLIRNTILALSRGSRARGADQHLSGLLAQCACLDQQA